MYTQNHTVEPNHGTAIARRMAVVALAMLLLLLSSVSLLAQDGAVPDAFPDAIPADQAALVINEFMASNGTTLAYPGDPSDFPDWVELYNPGSSDVSLNGLALTDTPGNPGRGTFPNGLTIPANGYYLFYFDADPFLPFGLSADGEYVGLYLVSTGEMIDEYEFGPQAVDVSMGRIPNGTGDFVEMEQPNPGLDNAAKPPLINSVTRDVLIPAANDAPVVTANVTDDGSVVSVTLVYSSTGNADVSLPMTLASGDNYTASIPAFPDDTIVRYLIIATDDDGNESVTPRFSYHVGFVAPVLYVNELVAENILGHEDVDDPGRWTMDWAEIYNPGDTAVSLDGLTLTDNQGDPTKYRIPNGKSVPAKGFIIVYLDEEPEKTTPTSKAIHASFALGRGGEYLGIYGGEGAALIHGIAFGPQATNVAYGLYPDGTAGSERELVCITPGASNVVLATGQCRSLLPFTFGAAGE